MNYYNEIKNKLIDNETYSKVKDYSKERHKVIAYFETGKLLYEAGSIYGEDIMGNYSKKLMMEVGKKYNKRTLFRMRQFYNVFSNEKVSALPTQLTWSHYTELLVLKDFNAIKYYINTSVQNNLTCRELHDKIKSNEYERLDGDTKNKLMNKEESSVVDFVKNPILIKSRSNYGFISEKILQRLILEDIEVFMKELGDAFCFIGSEYKI